MSKVQSPKYETRNLELPFGKLRAVSMSNGSRRLATSVWNKPGVRIQNPESRIQEKIKSFNAGDAVAAAGKLPARRVMQGKSRDL